MSTIKLHPRQKDARASDLLVEAVALMDKLLDYATHASTCPHPHKPCDCGFPEVLVKVKRFGVFMLVMFMCVVGMAQTNLSVKPMPTMGEDQSYEVFCTFCGRGQVLIASSTTVHKTQPIPGGITQDVTFYFYCTNPKCHKEFSWDTQRTLKEPVKRAVVETNNVALGPTTNSLPKRNP
jgi:hypothetical protein